MTRNIFKRTLRQALSRQAYARLTHANHCLATAREFGLTYVRSKGLHAPQILRFDPIPTDAESSVEIHTVVGHKHLTMAMWAWLSWYALTGRRDPLCLHDDGSLTSADGARVRTLFPTCRIVMRTEADQEMKAALARLPRCSGFRQGGWPISAQLFDYAYFCHSDQLMSFDSDLLFFRQPSDVIRAIEQGTGQVRSPNWFAVERRPMESLPPGRRKTGALAAPPGVLEEKTGIRPHHGFNLGFGVLQRASLRAERTEELIADLQHLATGHPWWTQTVGALLSQEWGVQFLSSDYHVGGRGPHPEALVQKHYTGPIRELFWAEGLPVARPAIEQALNRVRTPGAR